MLDRRAFLASLAAPLLLPEQVENRKKDFVFAMIAPGCAPPIFPIGSWIVTEIIGGDDEGVALSRFVVTAEGGDYVYDGPIQVGSVLSSEHALIAELCPGFPLTTTIIKAAARL